MSDKDLEQVEVLLAEGELEVQELLHIPDLHQRRHLEEGHAEGHDGRGSTALPEEGGMVR